MKTFTNMFIYSSYFNLSDLYHVDTQIESLVQLHDNIMFYLVIGLFACSWILLNLIINYITIGSFLGLNYVESKSATKNKKYTNNRLINFFINLLINLFMIVIWSFIITIMFLFTGSHLLNELANEAELLEKINLFANETPSNTSPYMGGGEGSGGSVGGGASSSNNPSGEGDNENDAYNNLWDKREDLEDMSDNFYDKTDRVKGINSVIDKNGFNLSNDLKAELLRQELYSVTVGSNQAEDSLSRIESIRQINAQALRETVYNNQLLEIIKNESNLIARDIDTISKVETLHRESGEMLKEINDLKKEVLEITDTLAANIRPSGYDN
jgi:hypothetical protein